MSTSPLLSHLAFIKSQIAALKTEQLSIEQQLLEQVERKYEGTSTGNGYKVIFKVTRSVDVDALEEAADKIPAELYPCKIKHSLDLKKWRELCAFDEELACSFVTEKRAKPTITILEEEDGN